MSDDRTEAHERHLRNLAWETGRVRAQVQHAKRRLQEDRLGSVEALEEIDKAIRTLGGVRTQLESVAANINDIPF